jgi:hypothetical protein
VPPRTLARKEPIWRILNAQNVAPALLFGKRGIKWDVGSDLGRPELLHSSSSCLTGRSPVLMMSAHRALWPGMPPPLEARLRFGFARVQRTLWYTKYVTVSFGKVALLHQQGLHE